MDNQEIDALARKIWDYHRLNQKLEKADCILVLGSNDVRVAEWATKIFLDGYAPFMLFSGSGAGHEKDLLGTHWQRPEADVFAEIAMRLGVPRDKVFVES